MGRRTYSTRAKQPYTAQSKTRTVAAEESQRASSFSPCCHEEGEYQRISVSTKQSAPQSPLLAESSSSSSSGARAHRLDFAQVQHCGRRPELQRLQSIYEHACQAEYPAASAVIVQAASGLGKTALVDAFCAQVVGSHAVLMGRGKFEEATAASEPFAAIIGATDDLLHQLATAEEKTLWVQLIREALASDARFLAEIIPGLKQLVYGEEGQEDIIGSRTRRPSAVKSAQEQESFTLDGFGDMTDKEWRFERFRLGLRTLLRCISTRKPVLFVLDDMHWAEKDSVTVIWTLLEDTFPNRRLMILGASRSVQVNQHLSLMMQQVRQNSLHVMKLDVLRVLDVTNMLASLFSCSNEQEVESLARIVHRKSNGNTFVILQFLRISEQQGHIRYSEREERWVWDEAAIVEHSNIAESVIDVVANKLLSVDPERKAALITAACFGTSHFEVDTIVHAMKLMRENNGDLIPEVLDDEAADYEEVDPYVVRRNTAKLRETLRSAAKDGLVEELSEGHFRFSHDRIREAAYSLLPEGLPRTKLHLKIGRQLRSWMETQSELIGNVLSEDSLLLNATNQLNQGSSLIEDDWERLDLAELNYQAAEQSARKSSFVPAMDFLTRGICQLGKKRWQKHYDLTLKLAVALTRIQFCCGMYDECLETAQEVIAHGHSFEAKKPVYHTQLLALLYEERQKEATELVLEILEDLSVRFPRKFVLLKGYAQHASLDKKVRALSSAELMTLSDAVDPEGKIEFAVSFLNRLGEISFYGGDDGYVVHSSNKNLQFTLEQGRHSQSSMSLFGHAFVKAITGQFDEAKRLADVALYYATEKRWPTNDMRVEFLVNVYFGMFKTPLPDLVDRLHENLEDLRAAGAMEIYFMDGHLLHRHSFLSGMTLSSLVEKCAVYNEMLLDYRQPMFWSVNAPLTQTILNLLGHTDNPTVLKGDHMDEDQLVELWLRNGNRKALTQFYFFRLLLAALFRNYDEALEIAAQIPSSFTQSGFEASAPFRFFFMGLAHIGVLRKKRFKRSLKRREVFKIMKKLKEWEAAGVSFCEHMELILQAELCVAAGMSEDRNAIEKMYRKAIESAKSSGIIQNEALANELAGSWMAEQTGKMESYAPYLIKAATLYEAWGGAVKVDDIMRRYPECFGEQPTFQCKSSRTMPMTGSFSSSMWSTSLCMKSLREPLKPPVVAESTTNSTATNITS